MTCNQDVTTLRATERVDKVIETLWINMIGIRALQDILCPIVNVYLDYPFESDMDWNHLLNAVAKTKFKHSLLGIRTILHGWTCTVCYGADHPSRLFLIPPYQDKATLIAPIVEYRNWLNWQPLILEVHKGHSGENNLKQDNTAHNRGSTSHSHGN